MSTHRLPPALRRRLSGLDDYLRNLLEQLPDATRDEVLDAAEEWCDLQFDGHAVGARGMDLAGDLVEELVSLAPIPGASIVGAVADRAIDATGPAVGRWLEGLSDRQIAKAKAWVRTQVDLAMATRPAVQVEPPRQRVMSRLRAHAGARGLPGGLGRSIVIARLRADDDLREALGLTVDAVEAAVAALGPA